MASDINKVIMIARLVRDPETKHTPSGSAVTRVSVANGYSYKHGNEKKETVSYFDLVIWGKLGEIMAEYGKKGQQICFEGRLGQQRWDDEDGKKRSKIEITVSTFQFLGGKKEGGEGQSSQGKPDDNGLGKEDPNAPKWEDANPFDDSDIPF